VVASTPVPPVVGTGQLVAPAVPITPLRPPEQRDDVIARPYRVGVNGSGLSCAVIGP